MPSNASALIEAFDPAELTALENALDAALCEGSLSQFFRAAWPYFDSSPFRSGWHFEAICEHLEAVTRGEIRRLLVNVPPRHSKPVWEEEWVLTRARGRIRLKDVIVGDEVLTHKGRFRRVMAVHEQGVLPLWRISTWCGRSVKAAADHPFLTPRGWKNAADLVPHDVVGIAMPQEKSGTQTVTLEEARLLGYLVGDGSLTQGTIKFTTACERMSADLESCCAAQGFLTKRMPNNGGWKSWNVAIHNPPGVKYHRGNGEAAPVRRWLERFDVWHKTSYTKRVPLQIMAADEDTIAHFVGAYWSCDGFFAIRSQERKDVAVGADSVNRELLSDIQHLLLRLGIQSRIRTKTAKLKTKRQGDVYTSYSLMITRMDDAAKFFDVVPMAHEKVDRGLHYVRTDFSRQIEPDEVLSVALDGDGACRCLTVEDDESFTVNDIVVSNTSLIAIAWPVWTWCLPPDDANPLVGPGVRFLCASYGSNKAEEDGVTARRLIASDWAQARWGDRLRIAPDRDNQQRYDTLAGGSRINTGIPESLGKGGIIRICFPADEIIHTERGPMRIGDVVDARLNIRVPSYCKETRQIEMKPIAGWHRNPGAEIYEIRMNDGSAVRATGCHQFLVDGDRWLAVRDIRPGASIATALLRDVAGSISPSAPRPDVANGPFGYAEAIAEGRRSIIAAGDRAGDVSCDLAFNGRGVSVLPGFAPAGVVQTRQIGGCAGPGAAATDLADGDLLDVVARRQHGRRLKADDDRTRDIARDLRSGTLFEHGKRAVPLGVFDVLSPRAVGEIDGGIVEGIAVEMSHLLSGGTLSMERGGDETMQLDVVGDAALSQRNPAVASGRGRAGLEHLRLQMSDHRKIATFDDGPTFAANISEAGNFVIGEIGDIAPDFLRVVDVVHVGFSPDTYCVTVEDNHTILVGRGAILIAANCDDPHKTKEVESDTVRQSVIRAYDEVWSTRSNDPQRGAEVVVMQRLAHNDLSGHLLEAPDVVHLCLPAEYDPQRHCVTVIGWEDPRKVDGEPLWPEMYPAAELAKKKRELGPYAWAGQYQQAPNPRGGGIVQREWWQPWPPAGEESTWEREAIDARGRSVVRQIMPDPEYVLVAADTAYTEKEENDWSACTVWSVFTHRGAPRVMLAEAWRDRLELRALCERLMDTCRRRQADMMLIENKASGPSVQQEMRRLMRDGEFQLRLENIKGDKSSRLHAVVPMFSGGIVYAPDRKWADLVIDEVASVPKGAHDDLADTVSMALGYLRRTGMARLTTEYERDVIDLMTFKGSSSRSNSVAERYGV